MFGKIYISILVSFSLFSCFMAIAKSSIFDLHLKNFRRSLYTLFLLSLGVGVITESINIEDWTYILSLTAIVVFIDLSVLLTPSILKIWQAEFLTGSEFLEATIKENEKIQRAMVTKVGYMSVLVQDSLYYFQQKSVPDNEDEYLSELIKYLALYCDEFGLKVDLNQYQADESVDLISLCSPRREEQARDAIMCLNAHKHVYAEKPAALSFEELDAILEAAKRNNCSFHEFASHLF